ncbi:MBL fold metallo-hydrolase [Actinobacteria bacterium YIM 96077]|uniref:MBL fold metallo-hydrolase n=1 Tax=Phytoactinopolyspora halophila TaxID=1981511 RepID=A0A329R1Q8_9ACTN|nr:MBL fold metallo-hydrolase [Phytoactinopolyspora halophila]AYY12161.1 MBL fold metallo-hydrolase [Actinobacteria bacterium YIM 96077]RAW18604.1 MBL fold metallo-hydrolase [Phytoactinopolyspora halophila]
MRLTVLGCSGSMPGPTSPASSYLVEAGTTRVVLDLGSGSMIKLQDKIGFEALDTLDAVLISHLHPDHYIDLCAYYVALRYGMGRDYRRVPVWGPDGTAERLARAYGERPEPDPVMSAEFEFHTLPGPPTPRFTVGDISVEVTHVVHPITAYAFRLEHDGRSIVYSGDTGPCAALVELARGADLMLCEAAFQDHPNPPPNLHLTGEEAGEHGARAGVARMVITHVPPWGDPERAVAGARATFDGPVVAASVGATWDI